MGHKISEDSFPQAINDYSEIITLCKEIALRQSVKC